MDSLFTSCDSCICIESLIPVYAAWQEGKGHWILDGQKIKTFAQLGCHWEEKRGRFSPRAAGLVLHPTQEMNGSVLHRGFVFKMTGARKAKKGQERPPSNLSWLQVTGGRFRVLRLGPVDRSPNGRLGVEGPRWPAARPPLVPPQRAEYRTWAEFHRQTWDMTPSAGFGWFAQKCSTVFLMSGGGA